MARFSGRERRAWIRFLNSRNYFCSPPGRRAAGGARPLEGAVRGNCCGEPHDADLVAFGDRYGQLIGAVDTTNVGTLPALFAISVPGCAVWPADVTESAAVVPDVSSNFQ